MPKCDLQHASAQINWRCANIPPSLPVPGTEAFAVLTDGLKQYGLSPQGISLDTPTSNLGDVSLDVALQEPRVQLKITYSGYEVFANNIETGDEEKILGVIAVVCEALGKIDRRTSEGMGTMRISLHLQILDDTIEEYLATFVVAKEQTAKLVVDAVAFKIAQLASDITSSSGPRIVLAKSTPHENSLYLEINYEIKPKEGESFIEILQNAGDNHFESILSTFGLVPFDEESSENDQ